MSRHCFARVTCAVLTIFFLASGCSKPTHESVQKDRIGKINELTAILKSITDEASANAAVPKIKAVGEEMKALNQKADALPKLSPDEQKTLAQKQEREALDAQSGMTKEIARLMMNPALIKPISDAMKDLADTRSAP